MTPRAIRHPRVRVVIRNGRIRQIQGRGWVTWRRLVVAAIVLATAAALVTQWPPGRALLPAWVAWPETAQRTEHAFDRARLTATTVRPIDIPALLRSGSNDVLSLGDEQALIYAERQAIAGVVVAMPAVAVDPVEPARKPPVPPTDAETAAPEPPAHLVADPVATPEREVEAESPRRTESGAEPESESRVSPQSEMETMAEEAPKETRELERESVVPVAERSVSEVESPGPRDGEVSPRTVTVEGGDSLWSISRKAYGDSRHAQAIYEANRDVLASPSALSLGQVLRLPDINTEPE